MPHWLLHGFAAASPRSEMAAHHLYKQIHKNKEQMMTNMLEGKKCVYITVSGMAPLEMASDRYWSQMPAENHCTHILVATENKKIKKSLTQEDESCSSNNGKTTKE